MKGTGGLLDRYVMRRFVGAYGLCAFGFLLLFLVVDFFGKLDNFLRAEKAIAKAGHDFWPLVGEYFATKVPWLVATIGPYLTLFAAIAMLVTFGRHNELTPMIGAGRSHHRVLAPVYAAAVLLVFGLVAMEEYVVPATLRRNAAIDRIVDGAEKGDARRPPHLRDAATGNALTARTWIPSQKRLVEVHAPVYADPGPPALAGVLDCEELLFRRHEGVLGWYPVNATLVPRRAAADGALPDAIRLAPDRPIAFSLQPEEINLLTESDEPGLSRRELRALIARHPENFTLAMKLQSMTTRPISSLVMLILGLPFVATVGRRSITQGLGVALFTCAAYQAVDFFFLQLGNRAELAPLVAAWFAPCLFGAIALARLDRMGAT